MPAASQSDLVSVIVPVYNAGRALGALWARLVAAMDAAGLPFEALFVDDRSTDRSLEILQSLAARDARVRVAAHARNAGQGAAVMTGIARARGAILVTIDDDLQHRPEDIPRMLQRLAGAEAGALIIAVAAERQRDPWREALSVGANLLSNLFLPRPLPLRFTTFCAFRRSLGDALVDTAGAGSVAWISPLAQLADRVIPEPVRIEASCVPRSRYRLPRLLGLFRGRARYFSLGRAGAILTAAILSAAVLWRTGGMLGVFAAMAATAIAIATIGVAALTILAKYDAAQPSQMQASPSEEKDAL